MCSSYPAHRQTDRQTDRQTHRQTDRQHWSHNSTLADKQRPERQFNMNLCHEEALGRRFIARLLRWRPTGSSDMWGAGSTADNGRRWRVVADTVSICPRSSATSYRRQWRSLDQRTASGCRLRSPTEQPRGITYRWTGRSRCSLDGKQQPVNVTVRNQRNWARYLQRSTSVLFYTTVNICARYLKCTTTVLFHTAAGIFARYP